MLPEIDGSAQAVRREDPPARRVTEFKFRTRDAHHDLHGRRDFRHGLDRPAGLIQSADERLYEAKSTGRSRLCPQLADEVRLRLTEAPKSQDLQGP